MLSYSDLFHLVRAGLDLLVVGIAHHLISRKEGNEESPT